MIQHGEVFFCFFHSVGILLYEMCVGCTNNCNGDTEQMSGCMELCKRTESVGKERGTDEGF